MTAIYEPLLRSQRGKFKPLGLKMTSAFGFATAASIKIVRPCEKRVSPLRFGSVRTFRRHMIWALLLQRLQYLWRTTRPTRRPADRSGHVRRALGCAGLEGRRLRHLPTNDYLAEALIEFRSSVTGPPRHCPRWHRPAPTRPADGYGSRRLSGSSCQPRTAQVFADSYRIARDMLPPTRRHLREAGNCAVRRPAGAVPDRRGRPDDGDPGVGGRERAFPIALDSVTCSGSRRHSSLAGATSSGGDYVVISVGRAGPQSTSWPWRTLGRESRPSN